ncbi:MAG: aspartate kinase [Candidatus Kapaibacteriales bacterium]
MLNEGFDIVYLDSRGIIKTDSNFTRAEIDFRVTEEALQKFISSSHNYYITGGFVGSTLDGLTTTLSRGGSDYTASVIAAILNASKLEIWTDVPGIMTTDPRIVSNAKTIKELTYSEASELAYFGAKVLHPKTIFPAVQKGIPVKVLNSLQPEFEGTTITLNSPRVNIVKSIAFRRNIIVITIKSNRMLGAIGYLANVFEIFRKYETSVDLLSSSEVSISLTIDNIDNLKPIVEELNQISEVSTLSNQAIVSVIGEGLKDSTAIASRIFNVLGDYKIRMVSMGASDINFSFVIDEDNLENAIIHLHNEFFSKNEYPELFINATNG